MTAGPPQIRGFTMDELERLEEIVCPRCGGSGIIQRHAFPQQGGFGVEYPEIIPCETCLGARRVWRLSVAPRGLSRDSDATLDPAS